MYNIRKKTEKLLMTFFFLPLLVLDNLENHPTGLFAHTFVIFLEILHFEHCTVVYDYITDCLQNHVISCYPGWKDSLNFILNSISIKLKLWYKIAKTILNHDYSKILSKALKMSVRQAHF